MTTNKARCARALSGCRFISVRCERCRSTCVSAVGPVLHQEAENSSTRMKLGTEVWRNENSEAVRVHL